MSEWTRVSQPVRCVVELDKPLAVHRERGVLAQGDENANAIVAEVYSTAGKPYDLSGCTVQLIFVRPDNNALPAIDAEISGNTATATLPDGAYAMSGMYSLRMQLRKNGAERTIVWIIGEVKGTDVDGIADPEHVISIGDIMASAKEAQTAASNAKAAAQRANAGAERAEQLQIDASGLAGDSNKLGGKLPSHYLPAVNLFLNSDWQEGHFIAQAGINGLHGSVTYLGDGWKNESRISASINANGITLDSVNQYDRIQKTVANLIPGKPYTVALKSTGNVLRRVAVLNSGLSRLDAEVVGRDDLLIVTFTAVDSTHAFLFYPGYEEGGGSSRFEWPMLLPGTYTAETLPPFVPRPYAVELAECRLCWRKMVNILAYTQSSSAQWLPVNLHFEPMAATPNVHITRATLDSAELDLSRMTGFCENNSLFVSVRDTNYQFGDGVAFKRVFLDVELDADI